MKKLVVHYVKRPYLLDLTIALILLPLFCHLIVTLHSRRTIGELLGMKAYWIPMAISYTCGLAVMAYIRLNNRLLEKNYGIDDGWEQRAAHQLRWNVFPPLVFVVLVMSGYFARYGYNIFDRGYFKSDVIIVLGGIILLVLLYYVQNKHRYFWLRQREQEEFDRLAAESDAATSTNDSTSGDAKVMICVIHPESRRKASCLSMNAVAVIDRHNRKTHVSTWDGQLYEWPMPATAMKAFAEAHGFTWLGQHYALHSDSVERSEGVGSKGRRLLLKEGIVVADTNQVLRAPRDGEQRTYLLFHKNIAKKAGEWFDGMR